MAWQDVVENYKALLITQYRKKTKAQGTIGSLVNCSVCEGLPLQLKDAYDLSTAAGDQLDIIGRVVGVPRNVIGLDLVHTFFSFTRYSGTPASIGFGRYASQPDANLFLRYNENATYTMSDFELLTVIKLRILYNNRITTWKYLNDGLFYYFNGAITIAPVGTMEIQYNVKTIYQNAFASALFLKVVPASMGCKVDVNYV
jgi:hypothetical protein